MPPEDILDDPVDMGFLWTPPVFIEVAKALLADPGVDVLIVYALAVPGPMIEMIRYVVDEVSAANAGKMLMICTDVPTFSLQPDLRAIEGAGAPVYVSQARAVRSPARTQDPVGKIQREGA